MACITAISYGHKQEKVNNYGAGTNPVSRGIGKRKPNASITLEMNELERIQAAVPPSGSIFDIKPFHIVISYMNPVNQLVTHTLHNAEFTENKREVKTGYTQIEVELPLIINHIKGL